MSGEEQGLSALLRYIAAQRDEAVDEIRHKAAADARELIEAARSKAARQVREALAEARIDADTHIGIARARSQARLRQARHNLTASALERVWSRISASLSGHWQRPESRAVWIESALTLAQQHLPGGVWKVSHPESWDPREAGTAIDALRSARGDVSVEFETGAFAAGLQIRCGAALLDASAEGLLRDRARIEGRWLAELNAEEPLPVPAMAAGPTRP